MTQVQPLPPQPEPESQLTPPLLRQAQDPMWGAGQENQMIRPQATVEEQEQALWQELDQYLFGVGEPRPLVDIMDDLTTQADTVQQALDLADIEL